LIIDPSPEDKERAPLIRSVLVAPIGGGTGDALVVYRVETVDPYDDADLRVAEAITGVLRSTTSAGT
jgi:hypothetical protein